MIRSLNAGWLLYMYVERTRGDTPSHTCMYVCMYVCMPWRQMADSALARDDGAVVMNNR